MYTPKEVAENYVDIGTGKTKLAVSKMLVLGILAGMFIAFGGIASTTVSATIDNASVAKLAGALVFPGGLAMVLVAGGELFTGNCLLVIPLLEKRVTAAEVLRSWAFVYIGNLAGGILVAALVVYGNMGELLGGVLWRSIINTAVSKESLGFTDALFRGILCNILVCIAVWMSFAAKTVGGKIAGLYFPVMTFVLCGFEHCVANMYFISAGLFADAVYGIEDCALTWGAFFLKNLLPVTLGNIIGGAAVGCAYWLVYLRKKK